MARESLNVRATQDEQKYLNVCRFSSLVFLMMGMTGYVAFIVSVLADEGFGMIVSVGIMSISFWQMFESCGDYWKKITLMVVLQMVEEADAKNKEKNHGP